MTPNQQKYIDTLEGAARIALLPGATGVFVVVASDSSDMHVSWHNEDKGLSRLAMIGLIEVALQELKRQTNENYRGVEGPMTDRILRVVPVIHEGPK